MKQAIVVRKDLKMSCGKIAGQVAHASVSALEVTRVLKGEGSISDWFDNGQTKIILKVRSKEELETVAQKCKENNIIYYKIEDLGKTQLEPYTLTCIGIGPLNDDLVDEIVGGLKLL